MSGEEKTKNDREWERLFERYDILSKVREEGAFLISADQIKEYREPRLMVKFDHRINLPKLFQKHQLSILPVSRKKYLISNFNAYHQFEKVEKGVTQINMPGNIQSLDTNNIPSEAIALNCAFTSGMLMDFLGEDILYPTVSGRMGTGKFDFLIQDLNKGKNVAVSVENSQMEIDAAYEGIGSLAIIEAKRDISEDFLVRQLYYPCRVWSERVTKKVRPIFFVYSNGIFSLYEYAFRDLREYNSLKLIKHKNYSIEDTAIVLEDLQDIECCTKMVEEPEIPFPQANKFERVINICELLNAQELSREQITQRYAFDVRQTNYYTDAAIYLGLVEKKYGLERKPKYKLTSRGRHILSYGYRQRQLAYCGAILEHQVFRSTFDCCLHNGVMPSTDAIVSIMRTVGIYHLDSEDTYRRRASTVAGWVNWMLGLLQE